MSHDDQGQHAALPRFSNEISLGQIVLAIVFIGSFLLGFLPYYNSFLDRLGKYDAHLAVIDQRLTTIESSMIAIQNEEKAGGNETNTKVDRIMGLINDIKLSIAGHAR